jgi:hypothetical protein
MFEEERVWPTFRECVDGETLGGLCDVAQGDIRSALPDHEMYDDERLKHDRPRGVAEPQLEGTKDIGDARFAAVRCVEDGLDIFGFGSRKL